LTTDFNVDTLDDGVTDVVDPSEASRARALNTGESDLNVDTVDKISIAGNHASELLTEISVTVEDLLNSLDGEVGVASVDDLEDE
jgi:hypothetical protein